MPATSLDLSQIKTDALSSASAFRALIGLGTLATQSPTGTPSASTFLRGDFSWQSALTVGTNGSIFGGINTLAAQKARRAFSITSSTNTITVLNATASDFDATTANALQIRYNYNNEFFLITRTVSTATQVGDNVTLVLTENVGANGQFWSQVSVVNTAETDGLIGGVVFGTNNLGLDNYVTISGGTDNTVSNWGGFVGGGLANTVSNFYSSITGGESNKVSGGYATIGGGQGNTVSGDYSVIGGGVLNIASGDYATVAGGYAGAADRYGMQAHAAGTFAGMGTAQHARFVLRSKTWSNNTTTLMLDGNNTRLTIPSGKFFAFTAKISGIKSDGSAVAFYTRKGAIKNISGTTSLVGNIETVGTDIEDNVNANCVISANDTNDALEINVTGISNELWRWVAVVEGVEITHGL